MNNSQRSTTQFADVPGGRLAYDVTGPTDGPLLLCVPGMGDVRQAFRFLVEPLVAAGYRVAAMDQRGHGESSAPWAGYGSPLTGQDMVDLLKHLGGSAAIIGHSSSAAAAIWAAAEAPALVDAVVLIGPFARQSEPTGVAKLAVAAVTRSATIWSRLYYPSMYKAPKPADFGAYVRALRVNLRGAGRMAATRGAMSRQVECYDRVGEVRCPVLVVMGSRDPDFRDPAAEAEYARGLIGATTEAALAMIEGAGHYPHAEAAAATTSAILPFIAGALRA